MTYVEPNQFWVHIHRNHARIPTYLLPTPKDQDNQSSAMNIFNKKANR